MLPTHTQSIHGAMCLLILDLVEGNIYRNPLCLVGKSSLFERFSFAPIRCFVNYSHMFGPYPSIFHGKSQFLMVKSQFFMVKSPFLMGERVKSPFFLLNFPPFFFDVSTSPRAEPRGGPGLPGCDCRDECMKLVGCMARSKECQIGQGARIGAGVNCSKKMWENHGKPIWFL